MWQHATLVNSTSTGTPSCAQRLPKDWEHKRLSRWRYCYRHEIVLHLSFSGQHSFCLWSHFFPLVSMSCPTEAAFKHNGPRCFMLVVSIKKQKEIKDYIKQSKRFEFVHWVAAICEFDLSDNLAKPWGPARGELMGVDCTTTALSQVKQGSRQNLRSFDHIIAAKAPITRRCTEHYCISRVMHSNKNNNAKLMRK